MIKAWFGGMLCQTGMSWQRYDYHNLQQDIPLAFLQVSRNREEGICRFAFLRKINEGFLKMELKLIKNQNNNFGCVGKQMDCQHCHLESAQYFLRRKTQHIKHLIL